MIIRSIRARWNRGEEFEGCGSILFQRSKRRASNATRGNTGVNDAYVPATRRPARKEKRSTRKRTRTREHAHTRRSFLPRVKWADNGSRSSREQAGPIRLVVWRGRGRTAPLVKRETRFCRQFRSEQLRAIYLLLLLRLTRSLNASGVSRAVLSNSDLSSPPFPCSL